MDDHLDPIAVTGQRLVDRVVDELVDHVVQAVHVGVADVHAWPFANGLETFKDLDVRAGVGAAGLQVVGFRLVDLLVFGIVFVWKCHLWCSVGSPTLALRLD